MATYAELAAIRSDDTKWGDFLSKVGVAAAIKATAVIDSTTPGQAVLDWANGAIKNPRAAGNELVWYVVGSNKSATLTQIYDASDTSIQTNVDAAVDAIYGS